MRAPRAGKSAEGRGGPRPSGRGDRVAPGGGFTLIELVVVTAIVMVLALLLLDPGGERVQRGKMVRCAENLRRIHVALRVYAGDHGGRYPDIAGAASSEGPLSLLVPEYTSVTSIFLCPGSGDRALPEAVAFSGRKISYAYYAGRRVEDPPDSPLLSDEQIDGSAKRAGAPLFSGDGRAPGANHRGCGGNLLLIDGSVLPCESVAPRDLTFVPPVRLLNPRP